MIFVLSLHPEIADDNMTAQIEGLKILSGHQLSTFLPSQRKISQPWGGMLPVHWPYIVNDPSQVLWDMKGTGVRALGTAVRRARRTIAISLSKTTAA